MQTEALCKTPPESVCDADYGLSIGRGAFTFAAGNWTHVRQTLTLNTPGKQDGGFALDVNGKRVIERCDVYYRGAASPAADGGAALRLPFPGLGAGADVEDDDDDAQVFYAEDAGDTGLPSMPDGTPGTPLQNVTSPGAAAQTAFIPLFGPSAAPAVTPSPPPSDILGVAAPPPLAAVATVTSTTTVCVPGTTVTLAPSGTFTDYDIAFETGAPLAALGLSAAPAPAAPVGLSGLFFRCVAARRRRAGVDRSC